MGDLVIEAANIVKDFRLGASTIQGLRGLNLTVERGEFLAVVGPSGSGKTTLLNILGLLDEPTSGKYLLEGVDTSRLSDVQKANLRSRRIGFVFQTFQLIPWLTALSNVELAMTIAEKSDRMVRKRPREVLAQVGLERRLHHKPSQLSGGEQQRVAMARALVNDPTIVLADEPTGNLDSKTSEEILMVLSRINRELGVTLIVVTHNVDFVKVAGRIAYMRDGRILKEEAKAR